MAAAAISTSGGGIGAGMRRRLSGFARTLRDNGFKVGLSETRDALAVLASPAATRPSLLKPALRALFAGTRSDWERFDEIFDGYWSGRGIRRTQVLSASPTGGGEVLRARRAFAPSVPLRGVVALAPIAALDMVGRACRRL